MKHRTAIWPRVYWVPLANAATYALIGLIVTYALVGVIVNKLRQPVNQAKRSRQSQGASSGKTAPPVLFI
jgi:hypothetical protein